MTTTQIFQYHFARVWAGRHESAHARMSARQLVRALKAARKRDKELANARYN